MTNDGVKESFDEEILKALKAGTIRKLEEKEMNEWTGPVNYNTLFPVIKEESVSTKVRIVSNSAQINHRAGLSVNDP